MHRKDYLVFQYSHFIGISNKRQLSEFQCQNFRQWRVAFAFDPERRAILLVGGDKGGADQRRFYKRLIAVADARFDEHLSTLKTLNKEHGHGKKT